MIQTSTVSHRRDENGVGDYKEGCRGKNLSGEGRGRGEDRQEANQNDEGKNEHVTSEKLRSATSRLEVGVSKEFRTDIIRP